MFSKVKMGNVRGLQSLLYVNFRVLKKYRVDTVAKNWKPKPISESILHKWISGDRPFPVDQLSNLVNATDDPQYLEYYANRCGYTLLPLIKDKSARKNLSYMVQMFQSAINFKEDEKND